MHIYRYICIHIYIRIFSYICMYVYMHIYRYICIHIYIRIYIYTFCIVCARVGFRKDIPFVFPERALMRVWHSHRFKTTRKKIGETFQFHSFERWREHRWGCDDIATNDKAVTDDKRGHSHRWHGWQYIATDCNSLQHTATHCNTLQHTATHCNTLQHTATHCNTLQHTIDDNTLP